MSRKWGKVLRAKVGLVMNDRPVTSLVTCWSTIEPDVEMVVKLDDVEPSSTR